LFVQVSCWQKPFETHSKSAPQVLSPGVQAFTQVFWALHACPLGQSPLLRQPAWQINGFMQ
jgi:hypothetical protein